MPAPKQRSLGRIEMPKTLSARAGGQPARTTPDAIHAMIGGMNFARQAWGAPGGYRLDVIWRVVNSIGAPVGEQAEHLIARCKALATMPTAVAQPGHDGKTPARRLPYE